jgi:outer membrane immunogenic protein
VKLDYIDQVTPANSFTASENMDGFHFGAGAQLDILPNVYVKAEYVRTDYEDFRIQEGTATIVQGVDRDNLVFGVGWRF